MLRTRITTLAGLGGGVGGGGCGEGGGHLFFLFFSKKNFSSCSCFACYVQIPTDNILKYFSYFFSEKTVCIKCQIQFSGKTYFCFSYFSTKTYCEYSLEVPHQGASNKCTHFMQK